MKSWSEKGRPALFQALEAVCRQIDGDLNRELQEREKPEDGLHRQVTDHSETTVRLRRENASLKAELNKLRDSMRRDESPSNSDKCFTERQPLGELSPNKHATSSVPASRADTKVSAAQPHLQQDYEKLVAKYNAVLQARAQERAALKKRKEDCNRWATYCDSLEAKIKKLESELAAVRHQTPFGLPEEQATTIQRLPPKPALADRVGSEDLSRGPSPNSSFNVGVDASKDTVYFAPISANQDVGKTLSAAELRQEGENPKQGSTIDEVFKESDLPPLLAQQVECYHVRIKHEPSSDGPVFVSERPVRKRKRGSPEPETDAKTGRVKSECSSSDPVFLEELQEFSPHESIDLDEDGQNNSTPKKRRSELTALATGGRNLADEDFLNMRASKRYPMPNDGPSDILGVNVFVLPDADQSWGARWRKKQRRLDQGVKDLAEDEDELADATLLPAMSTKSGRLDTLLNTPCPDSRPVLNRQLHQRPPTIHSPSLEFEAPPPRLLPFARNQQARAVETPLQSRTTRPEVASFTSAKRIESAPSTPMPTVNGKRVEETSKKMRLRQLHPSRLALSDFKINPKYNDGHDFAFSEVVRNKAERQNLMGCVDPQCCGKTFRALAVLERETVGPSVSIRAEDIKLLEEFLGANAYRLGSMSREEKEELWLEAKMRELANKHGKHRERYTRRSSPPGFWNTDFPSTQERQKEREQAEKQEERLVEERYKDAMRGNGRWLFRDE